MLGYEWQYLLSQETLTAYPGDDANHFFTPLLKELGSEDPDSLQLEVSDDHFRKLAFAFLAIDVGQLFRAGGGRKWDRDRGYLYRSL